MFRSEDTSKTERLKNGSLIQFQRLLRVTTGNHIPSISKVITLDANQLIQDGGNSLDTKEHSLSTNRVRYSMLLEVLTKRIEMSLVIQSMEESTSNGISSMLMNIRESQPRDK